MREKGLRPARRQVLKLVILKRGGQSGEVAINVDRVTHISSAPGAFTDVHFGDHRVAVEGSFHQVTARLSGSLESASDKSPARNWLPR
jgi:hypothetical protein